eukprot:1341052-Pyramimonas_sp.AAC.3
MYLDSVHDKYVEEVSSCNVFVVKGKTIKTPPSGETILPGITRKSIIAMARKEGCVPSPLQIQAARSSTS